MTTALLGMEATMQHFLRCAVALMLLFLSPALAQTTDDSAIAKLLHTTFDRPEAPLTIAPVVVSGNAFRVHAAARPPMSAINSRGLMSDIRLPPAFAPCEFGFVLAAAAEPTLADGITRLLAFAEKLHIRHDRLVWMVGAPMRDVGFVIGNADHQARRSCGPVDGDARRSH